MANLKAIRRRIKSVQATQKITRAMRLVAAAKVRKAQARTLAARPFTERVIRMLREVVRDTDAIDLAGIPLLEQRKEVKRVCLLVVTSDRGLCGSYNTTLLRFAIERMRALKAEGKEVSWIVIGLKGAAFLKHVGGEKHKHFTQLPAVPTVGEAKLIAETASEVFVSGKADQVELIYTHFISMLRSKINHMQYLPVQLPEAAKDETPHVDPLLIFEPTVEEVLQRELLPKYIENVIYQSLLDASASELAARMNAMSNASTNAADLIQSLTLVYNKARQASITQELLEVVGGAEALNK
ncbi:MAG: ATP synthase F1 subunit gamma [Candidatus Obscuribacterales bacterium]|jgi:F-type H+-transporting ATPase subunit gamma